jgi:hypothetical protein
MRRGTPIACALIFAAIQGTAYNACAVPPRRCVLVASGVFAEVDYRLSWELLPGSPKCFTQGTGDARALVVVLGDRKMCFPTRIDVAAASSDTDFAPSLIRCNGEQDINVLAASAGETNLLAGCVFPGRGIDLGCFARARAVADGLAGEIRIEALSIAGAFTWIDQKQVSTPSGLAWQTESFGRGVSLELAAAGADVEVISDQLPIPPQATDLWLVVTMSFQGGGGSLGCTLGLDSGSEPAPVLPSRPSRSLRIQASSRDGSSETIVAGSFISIDGGNTVLAGVLSDPSVSVLANGTLSGTQSFLLPVRVGTSIRLAMDYAENNANGDINRNGTVSFADLEYVYSLIGTSSSSSNYNPFADINADGLISISDYYEYRVRYITRGCASPADIASDAGEALPNTGANNGVTEADLNLFFAGYFDTLLYCDIADDQGTPLPPFDSGLVNVNNGVTEGDYNLFFATFFVGCP